MKTLSTRQRITGYAVAFVLGGFATWCGGKVCECAGNVSTRMALQEQARHIGYSLCAEMEKPSPSFKNALHRVTGENGEKLQIEEPLWHPLNALVIPQSHPMEKSLPYVAYCETTVSGKYLVISAAGDVDWIPAQELHALLESRNTTTTTGENR